MSLYPDTVPQLIKMLANLEAWIDEAHEFAAAREFEPDRLLQARLFPDMFELTRQVQAACDTAKFIGARLSGTEAPSDPDTETTFVELRARIAKTKTFLEGLDPTLFEGAGERVLELGMLRGRKIRADEYLRAFGVPNFYFHASMTYALLRKQGVKLGKRKFLGGFELLPE